MAVGAMATSLAVASGVVPQSRAVRISAYLAQNWATCTQNGLVGLVGLLPVADTPSAITTTLAGPSAPGLWHDESWLWPNTQPVNHTL